MITLKTFTLELIVKIQEIHHVDLISTKVKQRLNIMICLYKLQESDYKDLVPFHKALEAMLNDKFATT